MNKKENFEGVITEVTHGGRRLEFRWEVDSNAAPWFDKDEAPKLIAFIQQWLDHDPEQELMDRFAEIRFGRPDSSEVPQYREQFKQLIAAVREHDRKYRT